MSRKTRVFFLPTLILIGLIYSCNRGDVRRQYGIQERELWTTSRVQGSPEPPTPYSTEFAFANLRFDQPLDMAVVPGTNRLAIAERLGKIYTFENRPEVTEKQLLIDLGRTVYGFTFHPQFIRNGHFFTTSVDDPLKETPEGSRISRYTANPNSFQADLASEKVILKWPSGGHNGGCIRFGPDGYLYIATGDGSGIADQRETGQDVSDLLGSIHRIDVDQEEKNRSYRIPKDNPFVGMPGVRPEIWAYGLRQAWRFSFDSASGDLWAGEVGQDLWEMVLLIEKGGNYGWSVREGAHPFRPERPLGPTPLLAAVAEHSHTDFRSVTGGYVYHGQRLGELRDGYIYGDYDTGKIWLLRYQDGTITEHRELADTQLRIVAFGEDSDGELFLVDFISGAIHRLAPNPSSVQETPEFPRKLSETGLFASTGDHEPAAGLIPYSVNAPLWSDHAHKDRFLALPGDSQIEYNTAIYPQPAPGVPPGWKFPDNTVIVKTFSLEMEAGNKASRRRLETRILHHESIPGTDEIGAQVWRGYVYEWNDEQTDAFLLSAEGRDRTFTIKDATAPGGKREQTWRFPSRTECTLCHTTAAKYVLGVNTLQMNKDHDYDGVVANQLRTLEHLGIFTESLPAPPEEQNRLVDYREPKEDLNLRARSYLHANCAHCHVKWGGGNAEFQLIGTMTLKETGTAGVPPGHGSFELEDPQLILPGHPERSLIHYRMKKLGLGRMPHIASNVVDDQGVKLIQEWIKQLQTL